MANAKKKNDAKKLETKIAKALRGFTKGIKSKKLDKKITKYSGDLSELIVKYKDDSQKAKTVKGKKVAVKKEGKTQPVNEN